jgi:hypothetical protein
MNNYKSGDLAYLDTLFSGLVKCKVLKVYFRKNILTNKVEKFCEIKITTDHKIYRQGVQISPYKKNETYEYQAHRIIPRQKIFIRHGQYRVRTNFNWVIE